MLKVPGIQQKGNFRTLVLISSGLGREKEEEREAT
jgi:hypothetical protein